MRVARDTGCKLVCPRARAVLPGVLVLVLAAGCARPPPAPVAPPAPAARPALEPSLVAISVPDLDKTIAWYRDTLGFEIERKADFPEYHMRLAWLARGPARLELIELAGSKPASELLPGADNPALLQGFGKIGFQVTDAAGLAEQLERKGVEFQIKLRDDAMTRSRTFIILDNNGNWLQFSEPLG